MYIEDWVAKDSRACRPLVDELLLADVVSRFGLNLGYEVDSDSFG